MKQPVPVVIFAGGKSSRMGEDKALLPFGGFDTLAAYQFHRLKEAFDDVYLSSKERKFDFDAPVILDRYETSSPLVGVVSLFEALKADALFILSVDAPFVDISIIRSIMDLWKGEDAVIARSNGKVQPLCGLYARSILPLAASEMEQGHHKLQRLLKMAETTYVDFDSTDAFLNLNHPHEYEEARRLISS
jgi:molybdopterin-guanine dinucleotide biosynthesis protein A